MPRRLFPGTSHLLVAAVFIAVALRVFLLPVSPNDSWWHLAMGRLMVQTGAIPTVDVFSFTRDGAGWFNQPWLAQVALYGVFVVGGMSLMIALAAGFVATAMGTLLRLCVRMTGRPGLSAIALLVTIPVASGGWGLRSQVFALPLFAGVLYILTIWRTGRTGPGLWVLPLLMAVWVNVHGSFPLGLMLIVLVGLGTWVEPWWQGWGRGGDPGSDPRSSGEQDAGRNEGYRPRFLTLGLWGGAAVLAVLLNPRGVGVLEYLSGLLSDNAVQSIVVEWLPPYPGTFLGGAFWAYALLLGWAWVRAPGRPAAADALLGVAFFLLGVTAVRHGVWFAMVTAPGFAVALAGVPRIAAADDGFETTGGRWVRAVVVGGSALVVAASPWLKPVLPWPAALRPLVNAETPVDVVTYLERASPRPQRLFHSEATGSYLMWAAPHQRVFIDTRVELYPAGQWQDYLWLGVGFEADSLLDRYGIDGLLLDKQRQAGLVAWARQAAMWRVTRETERHALFTPMVP